MVRAELIIVPPGGGEAEYKLTFDLPAAPNAGDYISIMRTGAKEPGFENFIVRRSWWTLEVADGPAIVVSGEEPIGKLHQLAVECEIARGALSKRKPREVVQQLR